MENPIKMDDLGIPLFSETSICFVRWFQVFLNSNNVYLMGIPILSKYSKFQLVSFRQKIIGIEKKTQRSAPALTASPFPSKTRGSQSMAFSMVSTSAPAPVAFMRQLKGDKCDKLGLDIQNSLWLVVEPFHLKNMSQDGSSPQVGMKIKSIWNHHLALVIPNVRIGLWKAPKCLNFASCEWVSLGVQTDTPDPHVVCVTAWMSSGCILRMY